MILTPLYLFLLIELLVISYLDLKSKKIINIWPLLNLMLFFLLSVTMTAYYPFHWQTFVYPLAIFALGFVLFLLRVMGGGDAKLLATFFLLIPYVHHQEIIVKLALVTITVALALLAIHSVKNWAGVYVSLSTKQFSDLKYIYGTRFSFAPVILVMWLWVGIQEYL